MYTQSGISRRALLARSACVAAGAAVHGTSVYGAIPEIASGPVHWKNQGFGTSRRTAQMFTLDKIKLFDGPYREAMERDRTYLLSLDPDRFLSYFRQSAGLKPKAEPYGGWEKGVGRMLGHYLSACAMAARATSDASLLQRQSYVVSQLAECQQANGNGYVGGVADAKRIFTEIGAGTIYVDKIGLNGVHAPWYMLHKMVAGLRDASVYAQNDQALAVLIGFSDWASRLTDTLSDAQMQTMLSDEHGGMNEVFADVYAITGKEKYLTLSRRFNRTAVLAPLTQGTDDLTGLHANTQIPTVLGLYRQYEVSGDAPAQKGGEFFWTVVTRDRSYVNGGDSDRERFYPKGQMGQNLSVATAETCNSYNMVKLTDRLFAGTPREELAAYSERVLWNHILASLDTSSPGMTYYMSLKPGHFKTFSKPYDSFWCCVGTGMENHVKYGESIYFHSPEELWINQFIASEVHWDAKKMSIVQTTRFPEEQRSQWTVSCTQPVHATLNLRHPRWAGTGFEVKVNGKIAGRSEPGSYLKLRRSWQDGDMITASLPMSLAVEPIHDDPSLNAILYGPLVMAGLLGKEGMPAAAPYAAGDQLEFRNVPDPNVPALVAKPIGNVLTSSGPLEFTAVLAAASRPVRFIPLAAITRERYSVYWRFA